MWGCWLRPVFNTSSIQLQESQELLTADVVGRDTLAHDGVCNGALLFVQFDDTLLDAALGDQSVDGDRSLLPDAVGPIGCLRFDCRVPPGIEMDHVVRAGQIEPESAGL